MKLKLSLQRSDLPAVDLLATVDGATTVGDLADYLSRADPRRPKDSTGDLTLGLVDEGNRALDRRLPIAESGLLSGQRVTLSRDGIEYSDAAGETDAVVRIVDGPDAGRTFNVRRGANVIGREVGCEITLSDALVSRQHARLNITDVVEIVDLGSANGIVIDGSSLTRSVVRPDDVISIGDTALQVELVSTRRMPGVEAVNVSFVRSPRLDPQFEGRTFKAPEPPEPPEPTRFPVIALIAPVLIGAVLWVITKSALSLAFVALSPLMLVGNAVESRVSGKKAYRKALAQWRSDMDELAVRVTESVTEEISLRLQEHPSVDDCLDAAHRRSQLVWSRRPLDHGFLEFRLGTGSQSSRSTIELPDNNRAARELVDELRGRMSSFASVAPVPIVAVPLEHGALGVAGDRRSLLGVARGLMLQAVLLHSPADMVVAGFASNASAGDWDWLKWLPHTTSPHSPLPVKHLAASTGAGNALLSELEAVLATREEDDADLTALPVVLVLVEDDAPVDHSRLVTLAERGWNRGIVFVWLASSVKHLPAACRTYVSVASAEDGSAVGYVHSAELVRPVAVDSVDAQTAVDAARGLSPVVDVGARIDDDSDLPRSVSLLTITGPVLATEPEAVIERWNENRSIVTGPRAPTTPSRKAGTLRAVIGQSASEPLALDLRTDGPHALVGGTTGSGKSELLQTWILAMAAAHSPQRLTFLLVDYKGGSAFRDCVDLPHTVGLVTDLSPYLVRRALTSLKAELRFRERVLGLHGAKDLVTLEKKGVADAPPSLVIVVDEFAALVNEVPEFVDGVVDVAQRGRSLGLHLILATQRPAGVIKGNLRANTNLRLALRMADEDDSVDVLDSPEAAFFDQAIPGRAVSKTGPGRLLPFQAAYSGGWTTDEPPTPELLVEELTFGAGAVWEVVDDEEPVAGDEDATDIKRLVASVRGAATEAAIAPPRKPWLAELAAIYDLASQEDVPSRRVDTELVFGVRDDPEEQRQPTVAFSPDRDGNLAVYGTGGAGKSTLLRTLAIAAGFTVRGGPCHVYGIDFGGRGLAMLESLPHVGSIVDGSDHERITRLLGWLGEVIDARAERYSAVNAATVTAYRELANAPDEPRILLLLDGIAAFRHAYESSDRVRWFDLFTRLATEGRPVGVHCVLSSDQRTGMTTALASSVQARVVLRMADEDEYAMLNVPKDILTPESPPGRGLVGDSELQVAVLGGSSDVVEQARAVDGFGASMVRAGASVAPPIERLSREVALADLPLSPAGPVIGVASSTLGPFTIEPQGTFLVAGPPGSGRTTALLTIVSALRAWEPSVELHYLGNRRSRLAELDVWHSMAMTPDEISELALDLTMRLHAEGRRAPTVVVIEGIGDLVGGVAELPLQDLLKVCLTEGVFAVLEGETTSLGATYGLLGTAKSSRTGLVFGPDQGDGMTLFRTDFPRIVRSDFPAGRALYTTLGHAEVVQIAWP
jgi:S-DNA-T family DNA segregation ATPase FtsK/SpoIIIE